MNSCSHPTTANQLHINDPTSSHYTDNQPSKNSETTNVSTEVDLKNLKPTTQKPSSRLLNTFRALWAPVPVSCLLGVAGLTTIAVLSTPFSPVFGLSMIGGIGYLATQLDSAAGENYEKLTSPQYRFIGQQVENLNSAKSECQDQLKNAESKIYKMQSSGLVKDDQAIFRWRSKADAIEGQIEQLDKALSELEVVANRKGTPIKSSKNLSEHGFTKRVGKRYSPLELEKITHMQSQKLDQVKEMIRALNSDFVRL